MNKNMSKLVLLTTVGIMLTISLFIGLNNRESYEVKDISGNREVLNDVNVVYQQNKGLYKTTEVIVSKDKVEVDNSAKGLAGGFPLDKFNKEHRDIIKGSYHKYQIYKDNDSIGNASSQTNYKNNNKVELIANINDKNLKTNKINSYEIPLDYEFNSDGNTQDISAPLVYNGELYLIVGINKDYDYIFGQEAGVYVSKESLINIYKLDLENKESELLASRLIGKKEDLVNIGNIVFTYKDSFYFIKENYKKIGDNKFKKEFTLMNYNLDNKKFEALKLPINVNKYENIGDFYVEGDNVSFLTYGDSKDGNLELYRTTINLKDNAFINQNEKYTLKFDDKSLYYGIEELRFIDDKLYMIVNAFEDNLEVGSRRNLNIKYLYVIDEKNKEDLYIGKLKQESNSYISPSIVMDKEL